MFGAFEKMSIPIDHIQPELREKEPFFAIRELLARVHGEPDEAKHGLVVRQ
jgi:hypothetical protein